MNKYKSNLLPKRQIMVTFTPWWAFPENVKEIERNFKLTEEEKDLKAKHNLTDEQLNWRRWKIKYECGNIERFKQEYPSSEQEI